MGRGGAEAGRGAAEIEAVEAEREACVRVMRSCGSGAWSLRESDVKPWNGNGKRRNGWIWRYV